MNRRLLTDFVPLPSQEVAPQINCAFAVCDKCGHKTKVTPSYHRHAMRTDKTVRCGMCGRKLDLPALPRDDDAISLTAHVPCPECGRTNVANAHDICWCSWCQRSYDAKAPTNALQIGRRV